MTVETFNEVGLEHLHPSLRQVRALVKDNALSDLADSIKAHGVLTPLVVRPSSIVGAGFDQFEIICGHRRYAAAREAGRETVPVVVRNLNDQEALELEILDNIQRADVHPLDEAAAYARLGKEFGLPIAEVARRVGKPVRYVDARLRLNALIPGVIVAFRKGALSLGHANLFATLTPEQQQVVAKELDGPRWGDDDRSPSVADLKGIIQHRVLLRLAGAPWKKDDATLVPAAGPCTTCPKRTGVNPGLFAELTDDKETCTDPDCFAAKMAAHVAVIRKARPDLRLLSGSHDPRGKGVPGLPHRDWREVKKGSCPHVEAGLVVNGYEHVGYVLQICAEKACKVHWTGQYSSPQARASDLKARKARKAELAVRAEVAARMLQSARAMDEDDYRAIALGFWRELWYQLRAKIAARRGWVVKGKRANPEEAGQKAISQMRPAEVLMFLLECAVARETYDADSKPASLLAVARRRGIFPADVKVALRDAAKKPRARKEPKKNGARKPKKMAVS